MKILRADNCILRHCKSEVILCVTLAYIGDFTHLQGIENTDYHECGPRIAATYRLPICRKRTPEILKFKFFKQPVPLKSKPIQHEMINIYN